MEDPMRKLMAGVAGMMAIGGLSVAALSPMSIAGGQTAEQSTPAAATSVAAEPAGGHDGPLAKALAGLVEDKTITQAQADAVLKAVKAQVDERREEHPGRARRGPARRLLRGSLDTAAKAIGISRDDLVAGLKAGTSIADQARAKGVEPSKVEQAVVAAGTKRIDEAVSAGRLDADRAAKLKERLPEAAKKLVERTPEPHG
jgi:hypothetical protein